MAVVQNPIIGRAQNKLGGVIFQTWKGKNVLRSKPITVANPRTDAQVAQRNKITEAVSVYRNTSGAVQAGYVQQAVGMSQYNAFTSEITKNAMTATGTAITIDWSKVLFSKGTISIAQDFDAQEGSGSTICDFSWVNGGLQPGQSLTDKFVAVCYNETSDQWSVIFTPETRADEASQVDFLVDGGAGNVFHVWGFFVNTMGTKTADSQYKTYTV